MTSRQLPAPDGALRPASRWRGFRFVLELPAEEGRATAGEPGGPDEPRGIVPEPGRDRQTNRQHEPQSDRPDAGDVAVLSWLRESVAGLSAATAPGETDHPTEGPLHTYRLTRAPTDAGGAGWAFERDGVVHLETADLARAAHELVWQLGADALSGLDTVALHAGVLHREGQALLLPAPSGSGKSTLVAALVQRGWTYGSDEGALLVPRTARSSGGASGTRVGVPADSGAGHRRGARAGVPPAEGEEPTTVPSEATEDIPPARVLAEGFPRPICLDRGARAALGGIDALLPADLQALGLAEAHFPPARLAQGQDARQPDAAVGSTASDCPVEPDRVDGTALPPGGALPVALLVFPRYAPEGPEAAPSAPEPTQQERRPPAPSRPEQTQPEQTSPEGSQSEQTRPDQRPGVRCGDGWVATPVRPALALLELITNCFNLARFGAEGLEILAEVARRAPAYRLTHAGVAPAVEAVEALWAARTTASVPAPPMPEPAGATTRRPARAAAGPAPASTEPAPSTAGRGPTSGGASPAEP